MALCQSRGTPIDVIENNIEYRVVFNYVFICKMIREFNIKRCSILSTLQILTDLTISRHMVLRKNDGTLSPSSKIVYFKI